MRKQSKVKQGEHKARMHEPIRDRIRAPSINIVCATDTFIHFYENAGYWCDTGCLLRLVTLASRAAFATNCHKIHATLNPGILDRPVKKIQNPIASTIVADRCCRYDELYG
jgi:hypothetical protein